MGLQLTTNIVGIWKSWNISILILTVTYNLKVKNFDLLHLIIIARNMAKRLKLGSKVSYYWVKTYAWILSTPKTDYCLGHNSHEGFFFFSLDLH